MREQYERCIQTGDEMESYFEECKKMPFSNKVIVDMEVVYEFLTDIRLRLPEELKRSQKIVMRGKNHP